MFFVLFLFSVAENEKCEDEVTEMYVPFVRGHYSNKNAGQIIIQELNGNHIFEQFCLSWWYFR